MTKVHKILFTGAMGAGKTTAINCISDEKPISTEVKNTDHSVNKMTTTVGLDYGEMLLENGDRLCLFGTPGQERFDFMWQILAKDALGIVILSDNTRVDPLGDLGLFLDAFAKEIVNTPCVIGVSKYQMRSKPTLDDYTNYLQNRGILIPLIEVDVRNKDQVKELLGLLLVLIEAKIESILDN